MKRSIIKRILKIVLVVQIIVVATSCKDYLNIDDYFDDEFNIDSVFANARYMEAYMWGAAAMFPDESNTIRYGYTPGPMATDEGLTGFPAEEWPTFSSGWIYVTRSGRRRVREEGCS